MSVKDRLERIEKGVYALPKDRRSGYLCWAAARAGVPLEAEATFEALEKRIASYEENTASRILEGLEQDLEVVRE